MSFSSGLVFLDLVPTDYRTLYLQAKRRARPDRDPHHTTALEEDPMSLPWFRVNTDLPTHDKILGLLNDPTAPKATRYQAAFSYVCALAYAVDHETDGDVPDYALPFIHATRSTARLLVKHNLWHNGNPGHYEIHNYADRQPIASVVEAGRETRRLSASKAACVRHHGIGCWIDGVGCSREVRS
jgi:hypothetical protein